MHFKCSEMFLGMAVSISNHSQVAEHGIFLVYGIKRNRKAGGTGPNIYHFADTSLTLIMYGNQISNLFYRGKNWGSIRQVVLPKIAHPLNGHGYTSGNPYTIGTTSVARFWISLVIFWGFPSSSYQLLPWYTSNWGLYQDILTTE